MFVIRFPQSSGWHPPKFGALGRFNGKQSLHAENRVHACVRRESHTLYISHITLVIIQWTLASGLPIYLTYHQWMQSRAAGSPVPWQIQCLEGRTEAALR